MSLSARNVAAAGAACLILNVTAAAVLTQRSRPGDARLRAVSAHEVVAVPAHEVTHAVERIVVLGDSVGTGTACSCRSFGTRLAQLLAARQSQPVRVATLAREGQTTTGLVDQLRSDITTDTQVRSADAVAVVIGANDFDGDDAARGCAGEGTACFHDALAALPRTLDQALQQIRSLARPRARIFVLGYWNVFLDGDVASHRGATYQSTSDALTRQVDDVLLQSASRATASYVDLYKAFRADGTRDDTGLLADDGDHPNAAGHQRIAQLLAGYLETAAG